MKGTYTNARLNRRWRIQRMLDRRELYKFTLREIIDTIRFWERRDNEIYGW